MEALFRTVLTMSGTGAIVICIVLLVRLVLKRAPKRYAFWLWTAAAFRLICPVSWKSVFSIFSLAPNIGAAELRAGAGAVTYVSPAAGPALQLSAEAVLPAAGGVSNTVLPAAAEQAAAAPAVSLLGLAGWLWLAGIALMLIWAAVSYARLAKRLRTAVLLADGVWQSDAVDTPFLMGFFPPKIFIPFGLEAEQLAYVLAHERFHLEHRDDLVKLAAFLILSLHWFNPLVWAAFVLMGRDMEMRCDEAVLGCGAAESRSYSETLLSFAAARRFPGPGPLAFGESGVRARIRNALRWKRPKLWVTILAALLCVAAVAACAADPDTADGSEAVTGTPWDWTSTVRLSDIQSVTENNGATLHYSQLKSLVKLLNNVRQNEVVQGRGIPSAQVLTIDSGIVYRLRWGGGIIELDFDDDAGAAGLYAPAVWEIHNNALYDFLESLMPVADATVSGPGAYTGVDGYLRSEILRECETNGVTLFRTDGSAVQAAVAQAELAELTRTGALDGLAPEGTLESWLCRVRLVLAEDTPELAPVGALTEENGRYVLNWTHNLVALRYPNERVDVLYYQPVNDNMTFFGYHESYEEAIYDWYISAYRLDLPAYVMDWGARLSANGNYPVHRFDGDGWYLYIPVSGWTLTEATETRTVWTSAYGTGSTLVVRKAGAEEASADRPQLIDGQAEFFHADGKGGCWYVFTQYDPKIEILSSWAGKEPEILQYMAESFRGTVQNASDNAACIAVSGGRSVPLTPLSDGDRLRDVAADLAWLPITYDEYGLPFEILQSGERVICDYRIYDAETMEELDFFHPSGLSPQTYVFQNAVPGKRYLVTVDSFAGNNRYVFCAYYLAERGSPLSVETLRALQQEDMNGYYKLLQSWLDEIGMLGEQFESRAGEAGNWKDIPSAFAERYLGKFLNAGIESPFFCLDGGIRRLAGSLNAVSLTGTPRRLAFDVTLALGPADTESFLYAGARVIGEKAADGLFETGAEAVLRSDDGVLWTVESMNSGGSGGWGFRVLADNEQTAGYIRFALESGDARLLLRFLPNLNWDELSGKETQTAMALLQSAAVSDEPAYYDGQDQLIRDLYMLWGLKRADGAFAEMYLDGPDSILARQRSADPEAFALALAEMDPYTQALVRQGLQY